MKLPVSWLKDFVNIEFDIDELCGKLTGIGFEVEGVTYLAKGIERVVTGKIMNIKPHKDADKLFVCMVDTKELLTIVTGADNIRVGDIVPVAVDGAVLPSGKTITASDIRGVMSYGMLCSAKELSQEGFELDGAETNGILILNKDTGIGVDIKKALNLEDHIIDVSVTPNRPDCQCIFGLAREISAIYDVPLQYPLTKYRMSDKQSDVVVSVSNTKSCPRYMAAAIDGVVVEQSPYWMRDRLRRVGLRPINNIVDITNYVLSEIGQPMHAFDKNLTGPEIIVRNAVAGEHIKALDGKVYSLKDDMLVIASKNEPVAIAGVMGGAAHSVNAETKAIIFESARFEKAAVRNTARSLGLRSDSSARFERGVDNNSVEFGLDRALALISELKCGRILKGRRDERGDIPKRTLSIDKNRITALLGIDIGADMIASILNRLHIKSTVEKNLIRAEIPLFREDLEDYADIAEEIIRIYGYDKIISTLIDTSQTTCGVKSRYRKCVDKSRQTMTGAGYSEMLTYSFINPKSDDLIKLSAQDLRRNHMRIINPISEEFSVMRTAMTYNMLHVAGINQTRGNFDFSMFEISKVFFPDKNPVNLPVERDVMAIMTCGEGDFYSVKAAINEAAGDFSAALSYQSCTENFLHPGKSADIFLGGARIGYIGAVHPAVMESFELTKECYIAELDYSAITANEAETYIYKALPRFQAAERDLALVVGSDAPAGDILQAIRSADPIVESAEIFDIYSGAQIAGGKKSIAYKIVLRSSDHTLTEEEINGAMAKITALCESKYNAKLR